ncbi:MAG: hypothetical protein ACE5I5_00205 [Candidatus Heimdallarchaeota archaeon]
MASNLNRILRKERSVIIQKRLMYADLPDQKLTAPISTFQLLRTDKIVLDSLKHLYSATRSDLVKRCHLPSTTIYDALIRLQRIGAVERYFEDRKTRGRPKTFYRIL